MRKIVFVAAACAFASTVRADDAAEKVIKQAITAHGGEKALNAVKAAESTLKATIDIMGTDVEFEGETAFALPDKMYVTLKGEVMGQKIDIVQVVNGDKVKMTVNGTAVNIEDVQKSELKQGIAVQEMGLITPLLNKKKYTVQAETDEKVNGAEAAVVRVSAKGLKDVKMFFDKKTHLLVRVQRQGLSQAGGEVDTINDLSDYKKSDGVMTPNTMKVLHDGKAFMTMKIGDKRFLEKPDDLKKYAIDDK